MEEQNSSTKNYMTIEDIQLDAEISYPSIRNFKNEIIQYWSQNQKQNIPLAFNNLKYQLIKTKGPTCTNLAGQTQFYRCLTCEIHSNARICLSCFGQQHKNHNFKFDTNKTGCCDCGNQSLLKPQSFCGNHSSFEMQNQQILLNNCEELGKFIKEGQVIFFIMFYLKNCVEASPQSGQVSKNNFYQQYVKQTMKFYKKFCQKSYTHALFMNQILNTNLQAFPLLQESVRSQKIKKNLFTIVKNQIFTPYFLAIVHLLFGLQQFRRDAIIEYFQAGKISLIHNPFIALEKRFLNCEKDLQFLLKNQIISMPIIEVEFLDSKQFQDEYSKLYQIYNIVIQCQNNQNMLNIIFQKTNLLQLCHFDHYWQNFTYNQNLHLIQTNFIVMAAGLLKNAVLKRKDMSFCKKIIKQSYQKLLKNTKKNLNFSYHRLFVLSLCCYLNGEIYQLEDMTSEEIISIFGQQVTLKQINYLLNNFLTRILQNQGKYSQFILKKKKVKITQPFNFLQNDFGLLALDHIYIKILIIFVKKYSNQNWSLFQEQQINKLKQELQYFYQNNVWNQFFGKFYLLCKQISFFAHALQSEFPNILISIHFQFESEIKSHFLLNQILDANDNSLTPIEFKKQAQNFIDILSIKNYIKSKTIVDHGKLKLKYTSNWPTFTISMFSEYAKYVKKQFMAKLYEKKRLFPSNKYFNFFFSHRTFEIIEFFFKFMIQKLSQIPKKYIKQNSNKVIYIYSVLLQIESYTSLEFSNIKSLLGIIINNHYYEVVIPPQIEICFKKYVELQNIIIQAVDFKQNKLNALNKKKEKILLMRQKQIKQCQKYNKQQETQLKQIQEICNICKNTKDAPTFYLAHMQYLLLPYQKKPFLIISTCQHQIHEGCLAQGINNQYRIWYPCFVCKNISNIIYPKEINSENIISFLATFSASYITFYQKQRYFDQPLAQYDISDPIKSFHIFYQSLVQQIALYPFLLYRYFIKNMLPILKFIYKLLQFSVNRVQDIAIEFWIEQSIQCTARSLLKYTNIRIKNLLLNTKDHNPYELQIPKQSLHMLQNIIQNLKHQEDLQLQTFSSTINLLNEPLFYPLPPDLCTLRQLLGTCPTCQLFNHQIMICFYCGFISCKKCQASIKNHTKNYHQQEAVYIYAETGKYDYYSGKLSGEFPSLYQDYLQQPFSENQWINIVSGEFMINQKKLQNLIGDILRNKIRFQVAKQYK